jgi:hypothetical protein
MSKKKHKRIEPSMKLPSSSNEMKPKVDQIHLPVTVSFRHCTTGHRHCLSHCETEEVKMAVECLKKLNTLTWIQVLQQGGKGENKTGLGYTTYEDHDLKGVQNPHISPDVKVSGIRATQKFRIFGCYLNHIFFVSWFDPKHEIVPAN